MCKKTSVFRHHSVQKLSNHYSTLALWLILSCLGCDIFSPSTTLTGKWDCTLAGPVPSSATMDLKENSGNLSGTFYWKNLSLPINGTVNSKRQINMEMQESIHRCVFAGKVKEDRTYFDGAMHYYRYDSLQQASVWLDGGGFWAEKR